MTCAPARPGKIATRSKGGHWAVFHCVSWWTQPPGSGVLNGPPIRLNRPLGEAMLYEGGGVVACEKNVTCSQSVFWSLGSLSLGMSNCSEPPAMAQTLLRPLKVGSQMQPVVGTRLGVPQGLFSGSASGAPPPGPAMKSQCWPVVFGWKRQGGGVRSSAIAADEAANRENNARVVPVRAKIGRAHV